MATLKDWIKYSDDEEEQPAKREKIKKTSIKIKNTHAEDPEWKIDRDEKKAKASKLRSELLRKENLSIRSRPLVKPLPLARSRKIF